MHQRVRCRERARVPTFKPSFANPQQQGILDIDDALTQEMFMDDAKANPIVTADNPQLYVDDAQGNQVFTDDAKANPLQGED